MSGALVVRLSDVQPERVTWLWPGRVPLGKVTVLDGDPALGKTTALLDVAARITTGRAMPDGTRPDLAGPATVVILTAEDGLADTIRPRLDAAGADPSRVIAIRGIPEGDEERPLEIPIDVQAIADVVGEHQAALVIVDPLMAYLGGEVNTYRDQDVRRALAYLARLAEDTTAAVVLIRHLNKSSSANPIYRGGGSIGIIGAARAGLLVALDPDDDTRRILAVTKSNLSVVPPALAYRLEDTGTGVARVVWDGPTDHTAAQLLSIPATDEERSALNEAVAFLTELLRDGPRPAKDVQRQAREAGFSDATLRRAKSRAGITSQRTGGIGADGAWTWALPLRCSQPPKDAHTQSMSILGILEHLSASGGPQTSRCRSDGAPATVTQPNAAWADLGDEEEIEY